MKSLLTVLVLFLTLSFGLSAVGPMFYPVDLSESEELLFTSTVEQPGWASYKALLFADLSTNKKSMKILSYYPERSSYIQSSSELEIQNRFGLFRLNLEEEIPQFKEISYPRSFTAGAVIPGGRILPVSTSPDGNWVAVQIPETPVRGNLILFNVSTGQKKVISQKYVLDYQNPPALWSEDSRYLLYSKENIIYYVSVYGLKTSGFSEEKFREFGRGNLRNVQWKDANTAYYIYDRMLSIIRTSDFFPRSFYVNPLPNSTVLGEIPIAFDSSYDRFWLSPDKKSVLILKDGRTLFRLPLNIANSTRTLVSALVPALVLPEDEIIQQVIWLRNGKIYLLVGGNVKSNKPNVVYSLSREEGRNAPFRRLNIDSARNFIPSPSQQKMAILEKNGISIRVSNTLDAINRYSHPDPHALFWLDENRILIAGGHRIEILNLEDKTYTFLGLSSVEDVGFDPQGTILTLNTNNYYRLDRKTGQWIRIPRGNFEGFRVPRLQTSNIRVYSDKILSQRYSNLIMIRSTKGLGTIALFPPPPKLKTQISLRESSTSARKFDSRIFPSGAIQIKTREVSLVFDVPQSDEGLGDVLEVLDDYGLKGTFFVGGEFIRRNPYSATILAKSRHEIGSLFFTQLDMTDSRYQIDTNFVARGMGRLEDEYFRATGAEVSTIWHAPWYIVSPSILDATGKMNYTYVERDVDSMDWITIDSGGKIREYYMDTPQIVERLLTKIRPGSIISIQIGKPGKRNDYLFNHVDLLVNALLSEGYEVVPIGKLIKNAQY